MGAGVETLEPVGLAERTWTVGSFGRLWVGLIVQPFGIVAGSSLISLGLDWEQATLCAVAGTVCLLPCLWLNAMPGVRYGIPFPVYCRSSFGVRGAQVAALSRGLVAMGWLSLQLWFGTEALYTGAVHLWPDLAHSPRVDDNLNLAQLVIFALYALLHAACILAGMQRMGAILRVVTVVQVAGLVALFAWAVSTEPIAASLRATKATGVSALPASPASPPAAAHHEAVFLKAMVGVTSLVSGWSTLVLNITDLSRYAKDNRAQWLGQASTFPLFNVLTPFAGMVVAGTARLKYDGEDAWDLVSLFAEWDAAAAVPACLVCAVACLVCNVIANVVSPANDLANLAPSRISFNAGALASIALGATMCPWRIFASPGNFMTRFLVGYAMVTGAILGVLLVDYFLVHRQRYDVRFLYNLQPGGPLWFTAGVNPRAVLAVVAGIAPCLPGFFANLGLGSAGLVWQVLYKLSWFVAVLVSAAVYYAANVASPSWVARQAAARAASPEQRIAWQEEHEPLVGKALVGGPGRRRAGGRTNGQLYIST